MYLYNVQIVAEYTNFKRPSRFPVSEGTCLPVPGDAGHPSPLCEQSLRGIHTARARIDDGRGRLVDFAFGRTP